MSSLPPFQVHRILLVKSVKPILKCQQYHKRKHLNRCNKSKKRCKNVSSAKLQDFQNQLIGFEKIRENPITGKGIWKLIDENGSEHKHKYLQEMSSQHHIFRRRRVVDVVTVTDVEEARKLLTQGWDYQTSYPATISNIPHYVLVRKE
jgi:altronate dehydratase